MRRVVGGVVRTNITVLVVSSRIRNLVPTEVSQNELKIGETPINMF